MRLASCLLSALLLSCAAISHSTKDDYVLPFASADSVTLLQGYNGPYGHAGKVEFAYDFKMPIGTEVRAARSGVVEKTENRFEDATRKAGQENYIFVAHGDGTFARYYHLTKNGVL